MAHTALFHIAAAERSLRVTAGGRGGWIPNDVGGGGAYLAESLGMFELSATKLANESRIEEKHCLRTGMT